MWMKIIMLLFLAAMMIFFAVIIVRYIKCEKRHREIERKWREEEKFRLWLIEKSLIEENGPLTTYRIEADTAEIPKNKKRRRHSIS